MLKLNQHFPKGIILVFLKFCNTYLIIFINKKKTIDLKLTLGVIYNNKSTKGGGQILICVDGDGWYQEEGKEARKLKPGDIVVIPANVKHWHGATASSWFSHIAVEVPGENTSNEWCEKVTDEEYNKLPE